MVEGFILSYMGRLQQKSKNPLCMAENNTRIEVGHIYVCSGETQILQQNSQLLFMRKESPKDTYNPNINLLFSSFATFTKEIQTLGVILTGIGEDGVDGCNLLSLNGAKCLTEDASAIVDGMPSRARVLIKDIHIGNSNQIVQTIKEFCE